MPVNYAASKDVVLAQKIGNELVKLNYETTAGQVKFADGVDLSTKFTALSDAVAGQSTTVVVADIAARDAIESPKVGDQAWVIDASADETVTKGGAKYLYESAETGWVKIAETESLDVIQDWADIQNKPTSTVSQIDTAVIDSATNKADIATLKTDVAAVQTGLDGKLDLTGGTLTGALYLNRTAGNFITLNRVNYELGQQLDAEQFNFIEALDKNGQEIGGFTINVKSDGINRTYLRAFQMVNGEKQQAQMGINIEKNGNAYGVCYTPAADSNTNHIATTKWVNDKLTALGVSGKQSVMHLDALPDAVPEDLADGGLLIVG